MGTGGDSSVVTALLWGGACNNQHVGLGYLPPAKSVYQQLELYMEQQTGSKSGKGYIKAVYCHPAYLTYMHSTSCEIPAGWLTSGNQDYWDKYQEPQTCR